MKQKFLYLCFSILLSGMFCQTYAQTVEVVSLSDFSTDNPPASISVSLSEPLELKNNMIINSGCTLKGDLIDVVSPKRLKRDASFSFKLKSYVDEKGKTHYVKNDVVASYTVPVDKGELAKNAAVGVGNYFVKGLSMGVAAVEGAVKNEEDNRLKSSVVSVYEASPLSLAKKGEDLDIKKDEVFFLKFPNPNKVKDEQKEQNENYTIEKE